MAFPPSQTELNWELMEESRGLASRKHTRNLIQPQQKESGLAAASEIEEAATPGSGVDGI